MIRRFALATALGVLIACEPTAGLDLAFHDLDATALPGMPQPTSFAVSPDGGVAFGVGYSALWVQDTRGSAGRYEAIPGAHVAMVGDRLVVAGGSNGGPGAGFFTSTDGWATLTPVGTSPLSIRHLAVDETRVAVTTGDEVLVLDRAGFLAGDGADEAEVTLRREVDAPAWWAGTVVGSALRGDVLWIAAGDGVRAYDIAAEPPALLYVLGDNDAYGLRLEGDVLLVLQNERGGKYDVRDPYAPRIAGQVLGGEALDVGLGYVFGAASTEVTISWLGAPAERPEPVKQLPLPACLAVAALNDRVLIACDDQGTFELAPLDP